MKYGVIMCMLAAALLFAGCASQSSFIIENDGPAVMEFRVQNDPPYKDYGEVPKLIKYGQIWDRQHKRVWYPIGKNNVVVIDFQGEIIGTVILPTIPIDTYRIVVEYEDDVPVCVSEHGPMVGPE